MELAVAINEKGVVSTLSPFPMPFMTRHVCSEQVPLDTAIACFTPVYAANCFSNSFTFGPEAIIPELRTSRTASFSAASRFGFDIGIICFSSIHI